MTKTNVFFTLTIALLTLLVSFAMAKDASILVKWGACGIVAWIAVSGILYLGLFQENPEVGENKTDAARNRALSEMLTKRSPIIMYRRILLRVLNGLDRWLATDHIREPSKKTAPIRAWNGKSYDRALLLAVAYPILLPLFLHVLTGQAVTIGDIGITAQSDDIYQRGALGIGLLYLLSLRGVIWVLKTHIIPFLFLTAYRGIMARPAPPDLKLGFVKGALNDLIAVAVTGAFAGAVAIAGAGAFAVAFAFVGAVAVVGAGALEKRQKTGKPVWGGALVVYDVNCHPLGGPVMAR